MFAFRSTIRFTLAISMLALISWGQENLSIKPPESTGSFRLVPGVSFSASSKPAVRKSNLALPLAIIADDFREALDAIRSNHASAKADPEKQFSSAVNGVLRELDPHSNYYTPKEFKTLNDDHRGRYFGIGTSISTFSQNGRSGVYILTVKKDSPAEQAGLRFGDQILRVDGTDVTELDITAVRDLVRGAEGSVVAITVERPGGTRPRTFRVRRAKVTERSIPAAFIVADGVGYVALTEGFNYSTALEFDRAFEKLRGQGMRALVVDIRGNGGGLMEQAISIAEKFLPAGRVIVSQHGRRPSDERTWKSNNKNPETLPLALLVDENTASASEILAAAMQDNDRATIVGTRTFGKGLVQDVIPLENGAGLVLTSERYYAPSGRSIQRDYSDGRLYDYFRHINKGSLIDKPSFAAKTLNGRTVYGGDGIAPDVQIALPSWMPKDLRAYESAFFIAREGAALPDSPDRAGIERHLRWFQTVATEGAEGASKVALGNDPQMRAAIRALAPQPSKSK